ncbi:MAG: alpha-E domain-containing protein [Gammaproteobacteria bacterium]|nr:alpha-E domain-containing protein [Gammaproteobacteria bacterium]
MLSRVAEQLYWYGRHVERAENTARLVNVNANLLMDLPRPFKRTWANMIDMTGSNDAFYRAYKKADEKNVLQFMLADEANPSSMACCVRMARENARSSREILPVEAWETINEFYLYVKKNPASDLMPGQRHKYLNSVIRYCRQIMGMLFSGMSRGSAYRFVRIGRNLERADMSTRIIDAGCVNLLPAEGDTGAAFAELLWLNVLNSLSSYQIYRQHVKVRPNGEDVVDFLLKYVDAPRSVSHCLEEIHTHLVRLPGNDLPLQTLVRTRDMVVDADTITMMEQGGLHGFIDEIQLGLNDIHAQVEQAWFRY